MKRIIKPILCGILCGALCLLGVGCQGGEGLDQVRVCEVTHSVFYAPQYVAINLGFFKEEGIQIELVASEGADKVMTALLSGGADIGFAGPEAAIYVYNEGKENHAQVFAQLTKRDGSFLLSRTDEPDFDWNNLKGKTVLPGRKGGVPYMALEYVLREKGLIPGTDVTLDDSVQFANMTGAFLSGTGDYVTVFEPSASSIEAEGKGYIVASVGEAAGEIPYTAYFALKDRIAEDADLIQRFTNAVFKGQKYVAEHSPAEIAAAIAPSFPDTDLALLETVCRRYREIDAWSTSPAMTKESFDRLQTVMTQAGELSQTVPFEAIVRNDFAEKAVG